MRKWMAELYKYRELLATLVIRELKIRYKNSALGFLWSLIVPLVTVAVLTIVFKRVMGMAIPNYSAYVLAAYLPWMFFQTALMDSSQSVIGQINLVKKVYFPREILPLSFVIANLVHFALAMIVFFLYLLIYVHAPLLPSMLWLPLLLVVHLALITGLCLGISCLNVFYEDTKYVVSIALNLLFYLTPVVYFSEQVLTAKLFPFGPPNLVYILYHLNPMAVLMSCYRKCLLPPINANAGAVTQHHITSVPLPVWLICVAVVVSFATLVWGYRLFKTREWEFAEKL